MPLSSGEGHCHTSTPPIRRGVDGDVQLTFSPTYLYLLNR